ncbi:MULTISPECIES: NmrA family NAD(P)-binding protein [Dickeya]|uniref:Dihydrodipicolinate reductase n=1 Tax=Dickeya zeae (strain Ech586) TaxID=590409 RepID=D2BWD4_DICZ5|nr:MULTISPECIES: NAD(P)H-binding protein [Dickeya]ACZ76304.1 dihydrodipicolinate reductase [Dickeya parazeae Ech586]MBP2836711.1 NAD(P)H-binding protein [Dickeya parazeae]UCZ75868.1 NAD(P)H-binding protein [Dickeya zeae]
MLNQSNTPAPVLRIAVAGATGRVGSHLINKLSSDPVEIISLTRQKEPENISDRVSFAIVDFDKPSTLEMGLVGVDKLFISHGTSLQQVANEIALIDAAVKTGVRHIVKLSVMGPATLANPFAWHAAIEAHLAQQPVASTVLRPTTFMDVLKRAGRHVAAGTWAGAAGKGRVNLIDVRDIADAARAALLEKVADNSQRAYHLTGPRTWTMHEVAEKLSDLLGRTVTYMDRSPEEQRAALLAEGLPSFVAELLVGLDQIFNQSVLTERTLTVEELTGSAPRELSDWLKENIEFFR